MLTHEEIQEREGRYACCAFDHLVRSMRHDIVGKKADADREWRSSLQAYWAAQVMAGTTYDGGIYSASFASEVASVMDCACACVLTLCPEPTVCPIEPVNICDIIADHTVYQALDASQQNLIPHVAGRQTLIVSDTSGAANEWASHVGDIATDDGAGNYTYEVSAVGMVIHASANNTDYLVYTGGAGPYFPPIDGLLELTDLTLLSRYPAITASHSRTVSVEMSVDGTVWLPVYSGPETPLAYGVTQTVSSEPTLIRATYSYQNGVCSAGPFLGTVPPVVLPPCGVLQYAITAVSNCGTEDWAADIEFMQIDGWGIGTVTPTVDGVLGAPVPIVLGTTSFGPYPAGSLVSFSIQNNLDGACDIITPTYHDPRVPEQDHTVLRAVDANEYATLSGDGNDYYIVSNEDGLASDWGMNVGSIWLGASSSYQVVNSLEVVFATNPGGALGFWQNDGGTPRQLYPQPTFTYNTMTEVWVATMPTLPPASASLNILVQALCNGVVVTPVVYDGVGSGFATTSFPSTPCGFAGVTGVVLYDQDCAIPVAANIVSYTPTGDPDPNFQFLGVNNTVAHLLEQPNGGWLAIGAFTYYDPLGTPIRANGIARFNNDGTLDTAYNDVANDPSLPEAGPGRRGFAYTSDLVGNPDCNCVMWGMVKDSQGRVIVCGNFTQYNGVPAGGIVRLLPDGSRDTSFAGTGLYYSPGSQFTVGNGVAIDEYDRVVCTGWFNSYNGTAVGNIVMINPLDGSINTDFNTNSNGGFNFRVNKVHYERSTQTFIVNSAQPPASRYGGVPIISTPPPGVGTRKTVVRIDGGVVSPGALNSILAQGKQFLELTPPQQSDFVIQPDDKIVFCGSFTDYDTVACNRIVRLMPDGNRDTAFVTNMGVAFSSDTYFVGVMPNGQILVGGAVAGTYTDIGGVPKNVLGLIRINADGTTDFSWDIGAGFNGSGYCMLVNGFGELVIGGAFTAYDGQTFLRLVKLS